MTDNGLPAETTMAYWTARSLDAVPPHLGDAGLRDLAMRYALRIDDGTAVALEKFGPRLQSCLVALGCSPSAAAAGGSSGPGPTSADDAVLFALRSEAPSP